MKTPTTRNLSWRYNAVVGQALLLLAAWAPTNPSGRLVQGVFILMAAFVLIQAGIVLRITKGWSPTGISEPTRTQTWFPFCVALVAMWLFFTVTTGLAAALCSLIFSGDLIVFGASWHQYRSRFVTEHGTTS